MLTLQSIAIKVFASIKVSILSPAPYKTFALVIVPTTFYVSVNVQSTYQLSSVSINAGSVQQLLVYNSSTGNFEGAFTLQGFSEGDTIALQAIATDYFNSQGSVVEPVIYNNPPSITINGLIDESVVRPFLPVNIKCNQKDSCYLRITFSDHFILETHFKDSINFILDFVALNGLGGPLDIQVTNRRGQMSNLKYHIYVETSPYIKEVYTADRKIVDFNYNKLLTDSTDYLNYTSYNLQIIVINSNSKISIPFTKPVNNPILTKYGAFFAGVRPDYIPDIYDWNSGVLDSIGGLNSGFAAAGDYAIWMNYNALFLRNLATKTDTLISSEVGNWNNVVTENGEVVYWTGRTDYNIKKYKQGLTTSITHDSASGFWDVYPLVTDKYFVYNKRDNKTISSIYISDGNNETQLSSFSSSTQLYPNQDYAVNNNFIAYAKPGLTGEKQIWLRDTFGINTQITFFGTDCKIDGLNPKGDIIIINGSNRYLVKYQSKSLINIGSSIGKVIYRDSSWYLMVGRSLFLYVIEGPLTVHYFNFSVTKGRKENVLNWSTGSEMGVANFQIEKSGNAIDYTNIGIVESNNKINGSDYSFIDTNVTPNVNYYTLKILYMDGKIEFSKVLKIDNTNDKTTVDSVIMPVLFKVAAYPNPAINCLNLRISSDKVVNNALFEILSIEGKTIKATSAFIPLGTSTSNINVANLQKGTYFLRYTRDGESTSIMFLKQ